MVTNHFFMRSRPAGLTMIELMVVSSMIALFVSLLPRLFKNAIDFFNSNFSQTVALREGRNALEIIGIDIRSANTSTISIDALAGQPPYSRLTFQTVSSSTSTYWQENKILWANTNGQPEKLATNLNRFLINLPPAVSVTANPTKKIDLFVSTQSNMLGNQKKIHVFSAEGIDLP